MKTNKSFRNNQSAKVSEGQFDVATIQNMF